MARKVLADVATTNQTIDTIQKWENWSAMVECTQGTIERVSDE